jgi:hypothetical protein
MDLKPNATIRPTTFEITTQASGQLFLVSKEDNMIVIYDNEGGYVRLSSDAIDPIFEAIHRL